MEPDNKDKIESKINEKEESSISETNTSNEISTSISTSENLQEPKEINNNQSQNIDIDSFLKKITSTFTKESIIYVTSKRLYYSSSKGDILYFLLEICPQSELNPFNETLLIDIELIQNKKPYVKIRKNFLAPSLYDNRNYFLCVTEKDEYTFDINKLNDLYLILKYIFETGIKNFLFCLKESILFDTFIFYGDYELNEFYNINEFLENKKTIRLFRINQVYEKYTEEKYIILTELYLLVLNPKETDKSLAKLIFKEKLRDININSKISFNKKIKRKTLKLIIQEINTPINSIYEIEFYFIDRKCPVIDNDSDEDENNNANNNNEENIEEKFFKENTHLLKQEIIKMQKIMNFSKYHSVIGRYQPLFGFKVKDKAKLNDIEFKNKIIDYEKLFQFCEKVYNYYKGLKDKEKEKYKDRIEFYLVRINSLCAELMTFYDKEKANFQFYLDKIKFYLNSNEKENKQ